MAKGISIDVNERTYTVQVDPDTPLLYVLRNDLGLVGAKFGCGLGQCGTCAVIMDGKAIPSCTTPIEEAVGHPIVTIEGLGGSDQLHPLQRAFADEQAAQCGFCTSGLIMVAKAFLDRNPRPTEAEVIGALRYNLCRCGAHPRIVRAIRRAAQEMAP
jgi:nicotinate dehydrogenase subunit A